MRKSANTSVGRRQLERELDIQVAACRLVLEHGYDGVTMDQIAEAVGVSRRTLFNTVHDKESAVLGLWEVEEHPLVQEFRDSAPSDDPFGDLVGFASQIMDDAGFEAVDERALEAHRLTDEVMSKDSKVLQLANERFARITALAAEAICQRQGWPVGDLRAQTMAATLLALAQLSVDEVGATGCPVGSAFTEVVTAFRTGVGLDRH